MGDSLEWFEEKIDHLEKGDVLYRFVCFLLRRKLTYKEMFILLLKLNEKDLGYRESARRSAGRVAEIYRYLNGKYPEGVLDDESQ